MVMLPLSTPLLNKLFPYSILQTITSPKPSPPPTLKSWWLYRWNRFKQRTDKWGLLQWYLVILGIIACVLFSSLYQNRVMDLDRTNRIFYKEVIMDEKRKSVIMSWIRWFTRIRFSERIGVWSIDKHNMIWGWIVPHVETTQPRLLVFFQILLKKPSYSSSNIFQIPFLRPPSLTINLRSESCLRYRCTWRREMPMFSDIWVALIWGVCEINL